MVVNENFEFILPSKPAEPSVSKNSLIQRMGFLPVACGSGSWVENDDWMVSTKVTLRACVVFQRFTRARCLSLNAMPAFLTSWAAL